MLVIKAGFKSSFVKLLNLDNLPTRNQPSVQVNREMCCHQKQSRGYSFIIYRALTCIRHEAYKSKYCQLQINLHAEKVLPQWSKVGDQRQTDRREKPMPGV